MITKEKFRPWIFRPPKDVRNSYMFQVKYDSDSDGEDMEHWELKYI